VIFGRITGFLAYFWVLHKPPCVQDNGRTHTHGVHAQTCQNPFLAENGRPRAATCVRAARRRAARRVAEFLRPNRAVRIGARQPKRFDEPGNLARLRFRNRFWSLGFGTLGAVFGSSTGCAQVAERGGFVKTTPAWRAENSVVSKYT
jgi:hypothetical protein